MLDWGAVVGGPFVDAWSSASSVTRPAAGSGTAGCEVGVARLVPTLAAGGAVTGVAVGAASGGGGGGAAGVIDGVVRGAIGVPRVATGAVGGAVTTAPERWDWPVARAAVRASPRVRSKRMLDCASLNPRGDVVSGSSLSPSLASAAEQNPYASS